MRIRTITLWACLLVASTSYANTTYKVRPGDSFGSIAQRLGVSTESLQRANPRLSPTRLQIGQSIRVPSSRTSARNASPSAATRPSSSGGYVVKSGDVDAVIARRHGLSVEQLHRLNPGVKWTRLQIGQRIRVTSAPATTARRASAPAATSGSGAVQVRAGDTADKIARRVGLSGEQFRRLNPGVDWTRLQIGQTLRTRPAAVAQRPSSARPAAKPAPSRTVATRPASAAKTVVGTSHAAVKVSSATLRRTPSESGARLATVPKNVAGKVLEQRDGWVKLAFSTGRTGWIRGDLVREATASTPVVASAPSSASSRVIASAKTYLGVRYRLGGTSRSGFDCSGFVSHVMRRHGVRLPRTSNEQSRAGTAISKSALRAGDLVFFRTNRGTRINHVGIYLGGGRFIHASSGGGRVRIDSINEGYYRARYATARRVLKGNAVAESLRPLTAVVQQHGSVALEPEPETTPVVTAAADVASP